MRIICLSNNKVNTIAKAISVEAMDVFGYDLCLDAASYSEEPQVGDDYDPDLDSFTPGDLNNPATMSLSITLSAALVTTGTEVTATVEVRTKTGQLAPISNTYYAPVMAVDGTQDRLLKVVLTNGSGTVSWTPSTPGIYTVDTTKIRPLPSSMLGISPELIVE
ncbi:MAG: hypothetical protein KZQ94_21335 [Candidatus Thiodiazotropha sp. (ex Troendleina suluensis)]|nr:hypothetical protein [Candidatus Thiodiazotropha sp. (ex Troendleina suluensis)]